ncbi:DUF2690 domain-containing protein [Streptomyces sp. TRM 70361]|uniref:helix-turn-helix domain-containing protein n=1 Tax=Streptomyces sp. TRM 70361 TaxID=3116553 RepID=UPI002E7AF8BB|nr:DUF2690 domain-containing protein [Streptomyces sp. TRM 70361]MEE1939425.1 DUF2690 domain-containing protein [Streptomyces sp. TRM 70361]
MPRWKALPQELDPQIREFTGQLRRLVDRSGLSVVAVADRTGYSKTSWERYLDGRLLPPRRAIQEFAEVTGTDIRHLGTLWELAERAWSRAELRHDETMEAVRVAQARAALGEEPPGEERPERAPPPDPGGQRSDDPPGPAGPPSPARRPLGPLLAGAASALVLVATGAFVLSLRGEGEGAAAPSATSSPSASAPAPPEGVECDGPDCTGRDPEAMGCGGRHAETVADAMLGETYVEVRYSEVCRAAWARASGAGPGDTLRITAAEAAERGEVGESGEAYTPMVAAADPKAPSACLVTPEGTERCTAGAR